MSFILDALKKSEAERNRQSGPTLIDMRIAPPRRRLPVWILALTAILLANLVVLAIVLLRDNEPRTPATPAAAPSAAMPAAQAPLPGNVLPPPALHPDPPARTAAPASAATPEPRTAPPAAAPEPALTAPRPPPPAPQPAAARAEDDSLPSATDLRFAGVGLPELRLALHVYDSSPANRYVLLNSQRLREGDSTGEGVLVERVTEAGAILVWRGQRFRLVTGE